MSTMIHDDFTIGVNHIGHTGRIWLMASYLYYLRPDLESFLTDNEFDRLTQILTDNYEQLTVGEPCTVGGSNPPLSNLISRESLQAGSGFDIEEKDYPTVLKHAAVYMTMDDFWSLRQEYIFTFPYAKRVGYRYDLAPSKVSKHVERDKVIERIMRQEPGLQDQDRYYQGNLDDYECDKDRIIKGILLKDNEAEEFYNGIMFQIDEVMDEGLVLGSVYYRDGVGWVAQAYDTTRTFIIEA